MYIRIDIDKDIDIYIYIGDYRCVGVGVCVWTTSD